MAIQIQLRRDTAANWTSNNPVLASGEAGFETDTNKLKIGDGTSAWSAISYTVSGANDSVDSLTDTTITSPTTGDVLTWNGSVWINQPISITESQISDLQAYLTTVDLGNISDVTITTPTDGQTITYDLANTTWINETISITESQISDLQAYLTSYTETDPIYSAWDKSTGISITESQISDLQAYLTTVDLGNISDVTIATPTTGQVLKYNGTAWINDVDATGAGAGPITDLTDVTITTPANDEFLRYDSGNAIWVNKAITNLDISTITSDNTGGQVSPQVKAFSWDYANTTPNFIHTTGDVPFIKSRYDATPTGVTVTDFQIANYGNVTTNWNGNGTQSWFGMADTDTTHLLAAMVAKVENTTNTVGDFLDTYDGVLEFNTWSKDTPADYNMTTHNVFRVTTTGSDFTNNLTVCGPVGNGDYTRSKLEIEYTGDGLGGVPSANIGLWEQNTATKTTLINLEETAVTFNAPTTVSSDLKANSVESNPTNITIPTWARYGGFDAYGLSQIRMAAAPAAQPSSFFRETTSAATGVRTAASLGSYYNLTTTVNSEWDAKGPLATFLLADQQSIYTAGFLGFQTENSVATVGGHIDSYNTKMVVQVATKDTGVAETDVTVIEASPTKVSHLVPTEFNTMTTTERDALTPSAGWVVYNSTTNKLQCYNGTIWNDLF